MDSRPFKTRFAPSPTGLLHLGNIRTALFNYLLARQAEGIFLLRLEDTDAMRGHEKFARALEQDLRWLGLEWNEGAEVGGDQGPYAQSQRAAIYQEYFTALESSGRAYPCFCSEQELAIARKTALAGGRPPRYSGKCRALSRVDGVSRMGRGEPATWRFRVEEDGRLEFEDKVRGPQAFANSDIGDFIIRRSDGTPAFFFCNAIDDALMGVTLVVRGEDHLTNTPRQIMLLRALGLAVPEYAHIALVVGADGAPLSKRTGSRSVQDLREQGFLPVAIQNYLARLGHTYDDNSLLTLDQLASLFSVTRLHRAPARFDEAQLGYWQKETIRHTPDEDLWKWMNSQATFGAHVRDFVPAGKEMVFVDAVRGNITSPEEAFVWAGNLFSSTNRYDKEASVAIKDAGTDFFSKALVCLDRSGIEFKDYVQKVEQATNKKGRMLFMPLRAALTGEINEDIADKKYAWNHGPDMERIWNLLGISLVQRRLTEASKLTKPD